MCRPTRSCGTERIFCGSFHDWSIYRLSSQKSDHIVKRYQKNELNVDTLNNVALKYEQGQKTFNKDTSSVAENDFAFFIVGREALQIQTIN